MATNHQLFAKLKGFNLFHLAGQSIYVNILGNNAEEYWRMGDGFLPNTGNGSFYGNMNGDGVGNSVMYGEKLLYFLLSLESGIE